MKNNWPDGGAVLNIEKRGISDSRNTVANIVATLGHDPFCRWRHCN